MSHGYTPKKTAAIAALVLAVSVAAATAQQAFDRKQIPKPGPTPQLQVPKWTTSKLANGATLIVSERHDLPLV